MISLNKIKQFEIYVKRYMILQRTSRGKRSVVFKAFDLQEETLVALKIMEGHSHQLSNNEDNISKIFGQGTLKNTNLLQINDVFFDQVLNRHVIISEYVEARLSDKLQGEPLCAEEQEDLVKQIACGIRQMQDLGTSHSYLALDKVLLDRHDKVKLSFHHLQLLDKEYEWTSNIFKQRNNHFENLKFFLVGLNIDYDMWAFGLIIYFIVFQDYPCNRAQGDFNNQFNFNEIEDIVTEKLITNQSVPPKTRDLLLGIFKFDSIDRLSWSQIYNLLGIYQDKADSQYQSKAEEVATGADEMGRAFAALKLLFETQHRTGITLYNQTKAFDRYINHNFSIDSSRLQVDYEAVLGQGGFGSVYEGTYNESAVAVKVMEVEYNEAAYLFDEITCNLLCKSDYLVSLMGISTSRSQDKMTIILVMERMGMDLKNYLFQNNRPVSMAWKHKVILDILKGVQDLHDMNFVHCDLKLQNVLLKDNRQSAKLADFGLSKALSTNNKTKKTMAIGLSERYAAPEQLSSSAISTKCDIWALGLLIYEILTQTTVWKGVSSVQVVQKVLNQALFWDYNAKVGHAVYDDLIAQCLKYDRTERPKARDLVKVFQQLVDEA